MRPSRCRRRWRSAHGTKASTLDPMLFVFSMNLFGTLYSCNAVAPIMKRAAHGGLSGGFGRRESTVGG